MKKNRIKVALLAAIALGGVGLTVSTLTSCAQTETYTVTYTSSDNYTISIESGSSYEVGATVSFTVTASSGYTISSVTANGSTLTGTSGTYSFTMPDSDVEIEVTVTDLASEHQFVASASGSWYTGETLTISATDNGTIVTGFTVTATVGSDLVTIDGDEVTLNQEGELELTVSYVVDGLTLTDTITGTITYVNYNISQITEEGVSYTIRGTVVADNDDQLVVYDGTAGINVFSYTAAEAVELGNYVEISGQVVNYHGYLQYSYSNEPEITVLQSGSSYSYEPTDLTADTVNNWATDSFSTTNAGYYKWTATAGYAGNYLTLNIDGSSVNIEPSNDDDYEWVTGQEYDVEGWYYGYDTSYSYATVMLTSVELHQGGITVTSTTGETSVAIDSTLQLNAIYDDGSSGTVTWSSGDNSIATVDASSGLVTGVAAGTVTITATDTTDSSIYGSITITVHKTQATWHEDATLADVAADTTYDGYEIYHVTGVQVASISSQYASFDEMELTDGTTTIEIYNSAYSEDIECFVEQSDGSYSYSSSQGIWITNLENFVVGVTVDIYIIGRTSGTYENYYGNIVAYEQTYPTSVTIDQEEVNLDINQFRTLTITTNPELVSVEPTWTTSNEQVATVEDGVVTGISQGTAEITVSYATAESTTISDTITVTVSDQIYSVVTLGTYEYTLTSAATGSNVYSRRLDTGDALLSAINDVSSESNNLITAAEPVPLGGDTAASRVYIDGSSENPVENSALKFGSGTYAGAMLLTTSQEVSTVKLSVVAWRTDSVTLEVNGVQESFSGDGTGTTVLEYTFEIEETTSIQIGGVARENNRFVITQMEFLG